MIKGGAHHVHKGCSKHQNQLYLQSKCTQTRTLLWRAGAYNKHNENLKNTHQTHQCLTLTLFVHNFFQKVHGIVIHVDRFTSVYCIQDVGKTACCSIGPLKPH